MRFYFKCTICSAEYGAGDVNYVCPKHGDEGVLDTILDYTAVPPNPGTALRYPSHSMWRYLNLLPTDSPKIESGVSDSNPFTDVGWTPLYHARRLGGSLGLSNLFIKDEGRNPSASLKDRASAFVVAKAIERGERMITTASSGNAGAALACMAASVGMDAVIFVPESAPQAKIAQLLMFGATVLLVKGTYDDAFDLCLKASKEFGWYCRNTAYNPFTIEGKKTVAFEICEQLNWRAPDRVFVSVGDGNIISGVWKGFRDLQALGWIKRLPKLIGVQAEGSDACYRAWRRMQSPSDTIRIEPVSANTIADSISVGLPRDGARAVRAVAETGGEFITVGDADILRAMKVMATQTGVFAEPAGAASFAGLQKMLTAGDYDRSETIVVIASGNGLKDIPAAMKSAGQAKVITPTLEAVKQAL